MSALLRVLVAALVVTPYYVQALMPSSPLLLKRGEITHPDPGFTPDKDPFYRPPQGWESKQPGDILNWREIQPAFYYAELKVAKAYQILYRTSQNTPDEPSHTVTTVLVPHNSKLNKLVVGSQAVDSCGPQCAPSYGFLGGAYTQNSGGFQPGYLPFLTLGYVMTIPDKEGPLNAFGAGRMEGYMTLDSVRATLNFKPLGFSKETKVGMYGYSGGALTLGWAAGLQPLYAPELNVVGISFGGTPANLSGTFHYSSGQTFAGFLIGGLAGIVDAYPDVKKYMESIMLPKTREAIAFANKNCWSQLLLKYPFSNIFDEGWTTKGKDVFNSPVVQNVLKELTMGYHKAETPTAPLHIYHAEHDEIIPVKDIEKTVDSWCRNGAQIHYTNYENEFLDHETLEMLGIGASVIFIDDRMNGIPMSKSCVRDLSDSATFDPNVLGADLKTVMDLIWDIFGQEVGPKGSVIKSKIYSKRR